jgi:hypothetical protein
VRSCDMQREGRSASPGGATLSPRLRAECTFDLITIRLNKPA